MLDTINPPQFSKDWGEGGNPWVYVVNGREYMDPMPLLGKYIEQGVSAPVYPSLMTRKFPAPGPYDEELVTFGWRGQACDARASHKVETVFGAGSAIPGSVRA